MAKYFSESEMACHCCGCLPDGGIDQRLESLLMQCGRLLAGHWCCHAHTDARHTTAKLAV